MYTAKYLHCWLSEGTSVYTWRINKTLRRTLQKQSIFRRYTWSLNLWPSLWVIILKIYTLAESCERLFPRQSSWDSIWQDTITYLREHSRHLPGLTPNSILCASSQLQGSQLLQLLPKDLGRYKLQNDHRVTHQWVIIHLLWINTWGRVQKGGRGGGRIKTSLFTLTVVCCFLFIYLFYF